MEGYDHANQIKLFFIKKLLASTTSPLDDAFTTELHEGLGLAAHPGALPPGLDHPGHRLREH